MTAAVYMHTPLRRVFRIEWSGSVADLAHIRDRGPQRGVQLIRAIVVYAVGAEPWTDD